MLDKSLAPGQEKIQTAALHKSVTLIPLRTTANLKNGTVKPTQVLTPLFLIGKKKTGRKSCCKPPPEHDFFHSALSFVSSFRTVSVLIKILFLNQKGNGEIVLYHYLLQNPH